jgi:hypothetical protein
LAHQKTKSIKSVIILNEKRRATRCLDDNKLRVNMQDKLSALILFGRNALVVVVVQLSSQGDASLPNS